MGRQAGAQTIEWLGTRALGMGGAFVGVADDATAVYWNPAGLATGATTSGVFEIGSTDVLTDKGAAIAAGLTASRVSSRIVATTATSFGVSSYRLGQIELRAPSGDSSAASRLTRLNTTHYGLTLVQTVSEGLVIGGTVKLIRGTAFSGPAPQTGSLDDALKAADDLPSHKSTAFDIDAGAMIVIGIARAGVVVRNLRQPEFELPASDAQAPLQLRRHTRAGLAVTPGRTAGAPGAATTISLDLDVTRVDTPRGRERDVAAGGEQWLFNRRIGVRAGARWNILNKAQRAAATGFSLALKTGSYVDAHVSRGREAGDHSWGVSARVTF